MPRPHQLVDSVETKDGLLELRRRGDQDFMILINSRVLMTSYITSSELFLAESGCANVAHKSQPRVLIGGLGLGFTLRAALDVLPRKAQVIVAELNPKVIDWCRGPVAAANGGAALDRRVEFFMGDVMSLITQTAEHDARPRFDAILWDLYVGPTRKGGTNDLLYGDHSVQLVARALEVGGVFGVWGETPSPAFEERLKKYGFAPELHRPGGGGLKHAVYLAEKRRKAPRAAQALAVPPAAAASAAKPLVSSQARSPSQARSTSQASGSSQGLRRPLPKAQKRSPPSKKVRT